MNIILRFAIRKYETTHVDLTLINIEPISGNIHFVPPSIKTAVSYYRYPPQPRKEHLRLHQLTSQHMKETVRYTRVVIDASEIFSVHGTKMVPSHSYTSQTL